MPEVPGQAGKFHQLTPPLGLAWIAAVLEHEGISVRIVDLQIDDNLVDVLNKERPKLVCISGSTECRFECFDIARLCKESNPDVVVAYGGPHATFTAEDTLTSIRQIDVIGRGEGELTVLELARMILEGYIDDISDIKGISYRKNGEIIHNTARERIRDLDSLPLPARHLLRMSQYKTPMDILGIPGEAVMTSRGCPIGCSFCSASRLWGKWYTMRSVSHVLDEIELLMDEYKIRGIKFFDSTLTLNRKHIEKLCDAILDRKVDILWECEVRADTADRELFTKMRQAGCYLIDIGIESGSPSVLKRIHKKITIEQGLQAVDLARDCGLHTKVFLLWGLPEETIEEAIDTIEIMKKLKDKVDILYSPGPVRIYPGTGVERFAKERNLLPQNFSWSAPYYSKKNLELGNTPYVPLLIQPQFGYEELARLKKQVAFEVYSPYEISFGYVWSLLTSIRSKDEAVAFLRRVVRKLHWLIIGCLGIPKKGDP
jgi:radical SAM superfamily enzyme YgiQ (UPF0313 family)